MTSLRKSTQADAAEVRNMAKTFGYKVRVKVCNASLRVCGDREQVKTILSILDFANASGVQFRDQSNFRSWNQEHEVFAYATA